MHHLHALINSHSTSSKWRHTMKTSIPCQRLFHCFNPTPSNKHLLLAKVAPLLNGQQSSSQPRLQPRCQRRAFEKEEGQRGPLEKRLQREVQLKTARWHQSKHPQLKPHKEPLPPKRPSPFLALSGDLLKQQQQGTTWEATKRTKSNVSRTAKHILQP